MARHRKQHTPPAASLTPHLARRRLAGASAVAATLLALTVHPAAPPAPDRAPAPLGAERP